MLTRYEDAHFFKGYPFSLRQLKVDTTFPYHWHHHVEVIVSMQERVIYEVDGEVIHVDKGDVLFIWPGEIHGIQFQSKPRNTLMLQFDGQLLSERLDFQKSAHVFYSTRLLKQEEYKDLVVYIQKKIEEVQHLFQEDPLFLDMKVCSLIYDIMVRLGESRMCTWKTGAMGYSRHKEQAERQILTACQYISVHCKEKISLEEVANIAGFSKYYFSKVFKQYTGKGFLEFQNKERLRIAETLLKNQALSITEVALESGFDSISTFNRIFKQIKKVNPTEYRMMGLEAKENK